MAASLVTLLALGCFAALDLSSCGAAPRWRIGIAIGVVLGAIGALLLGCAGRNASTYRSGVLPLPFALIAVSLFGFGLLAWFWGED